MKKAFLPEHVSEGNDQVPSGWHVITTGLGEKNPPTHLYFMVLPIKLDPSRGSAFTRAGGGSGHAEITCRKS